MNSFRGCCQTTTAPTSLETSLAITMWSSLPQFSWQMIVFAFFPFVDHYLNVGPKTKVIVTVTKFVEWVSWVRNLMPVNLFWNVCTWLYHYHSLSSCPWGFTENGPYFGGGMQWDVFSQPFTHFSFGSTITAFEGFKLPQEAKHTRAGVSAKFIQYGPFST